MKTLISKLVWPAYLAGVAFLSYAGINSFLNASSILKDHTVVEAPIKLVNTTSRTKRGHTSTTYNFSYTYTVDDRDYVSKYSAVNEKGERFLVSPLISIAYSNADPAMVGVLHVLKRQSSLGRMVKGILIAALILGLFALFIAGWASPDDDEVDDDPEGVNSRDQSQTA